MRAVNSRPLPAWRGHAHVLGWGRQVCALGRPPRQGQPPEGWAGEDSHWRDCHFADALSPSLLKHLLKVEGVQQNDTLADG